MFELFKLFEKLNFREKRGTLLNSGFASNLQRQRWKEALTELFMIINRTELIFIREHKLFLK